jgi:hypothetical protein
MSEITPRTPEAPPVGAKYYSKQNECQLVHPSSAVDDRQAAWQNETFGLQGMRLEVLGNHPQRSDMVLVKIQYPEGWSARFRGESDLFRAGPQVLLPGQGYTETLEKGQRWVLLSDLLDEDKFGAERRESSSTPNQMSAERAGDLLKNEDTKVRHSDEKHDVVKVMQAAHKALTDTKGTEE